MLVAVIGGTRHIGPDIVELLVEAGHQVSVYNRGLTPAELPDCVQRVVVDRKIPGQLTAALRDNQPEAVIDMVGFVKDDVEEVLSALPSLRHYVFCSSTVLYGCIEWTTPDESTLVAPDSGYGHGKVACDDFLMEQYQKNGRPVTSLRLAHPYGPRDHMLYVTGRESLFLDRMRQQRTIIIPGSGNTRVHPIYVRDAARAFVYVLGRSECMGKIYNLSGDEILTLDEYFASIARVLPVPLVARKIPHEFFRDYAQLWSDWPRKFNFGFNWVHYQSAFDVSALRQTGFRCQTDHDAGVALMMEWLDAKGLVEQSSDKDGEDLIFDHLDRLNGWS